MKCEILYEDSEILVINKPAGLASQSAGVSQPDAVSELKNYLAKAGAKPGQPYLGIVHRLDQPVEGILVFAKTPKAAANLTKQLGEGVLNKQYYAVVCGKPLAENGVLVDYLLKETSGLAKVVTGKEKQFPQAKYAKLDYKTIKTAAVGEQSVSLLDITIETGRFHQIRAQMAHAGYPLLGDRKYGNEVSLSVSREALVANVALCAYRLEIVHPVNGKRMFWEIIPKGKVFSMMQK